MRTFPEGTVSRGEKANSFGSSGGVGSLDLIVIIFPKTDSEGSLCNEPFLTAAAGPPIGNFVAYDINF